MFSALIPYFAAVTNKPCGGGSFLGFPTWYHYLPSMHTGGTCTPAINNINDVWLVVAAIIEILLRIAAIVALVFVLYGSFSYVTSQGEPDKTAKARGTIVNSLIGLAIAVMSASIVAFIARSIT